MERVLRGHGLGAPFRAVESNRHAALDQFFAAAACWFKPPFFGLRPRPSAYGRFPARGSGSPIGARRSFQPPSERLLQAYIIRLSDEMAPTTVIPNLSDLGAVVTAEHYGAAERVGGPTFDYRA